MQRDTRARRHLMVPGQPRRATPTAASTVMVQRWVLTVLVTSVVFHLAAGLVVAAVMISPDAPTPRIGLLVIAAVMSMLIVVADLVIHGRNPLSPWLAIGLVPSAVGAYLCFAR